MSKVKLARWAVAFAALHLYQVIFPSIGLALTGGSGSPEFSSFEPVATTDMVNIFSGDFTYNLPVVQIPGPNGSGYSLSLSYHSGSNPEEEASWVGFGWTLNPGSINRQSRGVPDDYKGAVITKYNKVMPNWTASAKVDGGLEYFSKDDNSLASLRANQSVRYNNSIGITKSFGLSTTFKGMGSLGFTSSNGEVTFNANINPAGILSQLGKEQEENEDKKPKKKKLADVIKEIPAKSKEEMVKKVRNAFNAERLLSNLASGFTSSYGIYSIFAGASPSANRPYEGISHNYSLSVQSNPSPTPVGIETGLSGSFNIQVSKPEMDMNSYGYFYNPVHGDYSHPADDGVMADYAVERGSTYDNRDYYLGIPYNTADNFAVSGEGIGGGFRLYHNDLGHYYPNFTLSEQKIRNFAIEFAFGTDIEVGFDFGVGYQRNKVGSWKEADQASVASGDVQFAGFPSSPEEFSGDLPVFRFNNDLGGSVEYGSNTNPVTAQIEAPLLASVPGVKKFSAELEETGLDNGYTSNHEIGRSSYIFYNMYDENGGAVFPLAGKSEELNEARATKSSDEIKNGLFEIATTNEAGMKYTYGLPVYVKDETSISVPIDVDAGDEVVNNYLAYKEDVKVHDDIMKNPFVVGEKKGQPYTNMYLLTSITTPEFVDVTENGPTEDDFGGWTSFHYDRLYGGATSGTWYRYRTPYTGLNFQKNSLSDPDDDMGSVSTGYKEVYYLKAIETKTHMAFFVTNQSNPSDFADYVSVSALGTSLSNALQGSGDTRFDGLAANDETYTNSASEVNNETAARDKGVSSSLGLRRLEKIVLVAKSDLSMPMKVVNFEYDYSLVRNLPNSTNGTFPDNPGSGYQHSGKLTLKRVWFEYDGVVRAKIAPYEFKYEYKKSYKYPAEVTAKYQSVLGDVDAFTAVDQNPDYKPYALDAWGNYQYNGEDRFALLKPWVPQEAASARFDPAAWQLKQIILPSGGEIHVQYEQDDYMYVQGEKAMAMVSLLPSSEDAPVGGKYYDATGASYIINLADLNITSATDAATYAGQLNEYFRANGPDEEKRKIYFKFLYSLKGGGASLESCTSDYITGYSVVKSVEESGGIITLKLGSDQTGITDKRPDIPRELCYDFTTNQRSGKLDNSSCTNDFEKKVEEEIMDLLGNELDFANIKDNMSAYRSNVALYAMTKLEADLNYQIGKRKDVCKTVNFPLSYLKLPVFNAKKGGGVRVKRLLTFDPGIESGAAMLYGQEFHYVQEGVGAGSSGVATNEPGPAREENPLVTFLAKKQKSFVGRLIGGRDKEQVEGPLGEYLLPGASVGYSRVVVSNIHNDINGTGFTVHEYLTCKDYPFNDIYFDNSGNRDVTGPTVAHTQLEDNKKRDWMKLPTPVFNYNVDKRWVSQGYRFVINNMHGQLKKQSTYAGQYVEPGLGFSEPILYSSTTNEYFEPGEKVPMLKLDPSGETITTELQNPGKEEDITIEMKSVEDKTFDFSLEMDIGIGLAPICQPITVSFWLTLGYEENELNTHTTTKVLRYPAIMKGTETYKDGVVHKTSYIAFDENTGRPVVTRNADGFDGLIIDGEVHDGGFYTWTIPAAWIYPELGQKAEQTSSSFRTNQLVANAATITTYGKQGNWLALDADWFDENDPGVVSAEANTYKKNWFAASGAIAEQYGLSGNAALDRLNAIWRPESRFVYQTDVVSANESNGHIANGGVFADFTMYDWENGLSGNKWIELEKNSMYDPNGNIVEKISLPNDLNIASSTRYGYSNLLPVMAASNALFEEIFFEDFENSTYAAQSSYHSGERSLHLNANPGYAFVDGQVRLTQNMLEEGAIIKCWVKHVLPASADLEYEIKDKLNLRINNSLDVPLSWVARTGEWQLFEAKVSNWGTITSGTPLEITMVSAVEGAHGIFIDDFRFQPAGAQASCSVYDKSTFNTLVAFDDQHFGTYYQYNSEGKLIRIIKETERGFRTIKETQYNQPRLDEI